jgi:hypothetical protein
LLTLSETQLNGEKLKQDNQTLFSALREKNKKYQQTQELYDRLKRKEIATTTQNAAFNSVDDILQARIGGAENCFHQGSHISPLRGYTSVPGGPSNMSFNNSMQQPRGIEQPEGSIFRSPQRRVPLGNQLAFGMFSQYISFSSSFLY